MAKNQTLKQRILQKIKKLKNGCWEWQGAKFKKSNGDYGQIRIGTRKHSRTVKAHQVSYEIFVKKIPVGMEIDHLCHNTLCVNPKHLEAVTHKVNMERRKDHGLPFCKRGHKYTKETIHINVRGVRECRVCRNILEKQRILRIRKT